MKTKDDFCNAYYGICYFIFLRLVDTNIILLHHIPVLYCCTKGVGSLPVCLHFQRREKGSVYPWKSC